MTTLTQFTKKTSIALTLLAVTSGSLAASAHAQSNEDSVSESSDKSVCKMNMTADLNFAKC